MPADDTLKNAAIGAVASIVLFFLPFSPALGGALAGYLQGGDTDEGLRVGALSGAIAAVPLAVLAVLVTAVFVIAAPGRAALAFVVFFVVVLFVALLYGVGLGALGGLLGAYLNEEFDGSARTSPEPVHRKPESARDERVPASERPAFEGSPAGVDERDAAAGDADVRGRDSRTDDGWDADRR
ncbi:DUF5518 domain-containing protein [Halorarum halophilum]|uniref:DUF5518 domain-containing protein n=1 Tax=Halorarum halophilum TaxID=2743090 RepID=UPI001FE7DC46|nr:DUF5518 domain-containing protein [Halobaculum halophilum]